MRPIPRDPLPDATVALLGDPYRYIARRCRHLGSDVFRTRLMLRPAICMTGHEAARLFYDRERFERRGAAPGRVRKTLFGEGAVQGLDGEEHARRKAMLLSTMTPAQVARLGALSLAAWRGWAARTGRDGGRAVLYDAAREVLCRAVCAWAAVPLPEPEVAHRAAQLTALFDGAGAIGPRHWRSRVARRRANGWVAGLVEDVRTCRLEPPGESPLTVVALHRGCGGELLPAPVAAVELLNLLRPTVAVAVYVAFVALALHRHPDCRERIRSGGPGELERFVLEVRRFYPFFPAAVARVRRDFEWRGHRFPRGTRTLLDLHGIDHDPRLWEAPDVFRPERFAGREIDAFSLVPQGGGDPADGHRCAGEWATVELMKRSAAFLAGEVRYRVPAQDLRVDEARLPALPRSGFEIHGVELAA